MNRMRKRKTAFGFTLFEVMIALGVFMIAVTALVVALQTSVQAALEARKRSLARMQLESCLSIAMADPPINGRRIIEARVAHARKALRELDRVTRVELSRTRASSTPAPLVFVGTVADAVFFKTVRGGRRHGQHY